MTPEEFIRRKKIYDVALTSEQVDAMTQQFREAAAWIVGQNEAYIIEIYYRAAERIASGELSAAAARRVVREALEAAGYRADAPGSWRDLKDGTARQKLVLETNVNKAAGYAWRETVKGIGSLPAQELVRFEQRDVPRDWVTRWRNAWAALPPEERKKALPGPRMVALVECRIWNEISRWKDPYPPFDYNSGMDVLPVDAEEAAQLGLVRDEEVPRSEEAEDFGVKKELPESEHGADLREIEQWIKEMEAEIAAEDTRMRAEGIITNSANRVVMNSGPGGEDCRAKSVETCRCKGMPKRKQGRRELPKDTPLRAIKPGEWAAMIGNGVTIENPLGEKVTLTQGVEKDWKNKSRKEREWRQRNLPYALETLKNPQEIWQGYKGNKVHVSRYAEDAKNHQPERVVNVVTHGEKVVTYYVEKRNPEKMDKYRNGKLLYERKAADAGKASAE